MKALKAFTVSVSVFRSQILWLFSPFKINIAPAAPDLKFILFPLWYWPIMNAHAKQQQDKVFETDFIHSQKLNTHDVHLLALSHIALLRCACTFVFRFLELSWQSAYSAPWTKRSTDHCTTTLITPTIQSLNTSDAPNFFRSLCMWASINTLLWTVVKDSLHFITWLVSSRKV